MKALVIGGGIAGPVAAMALHKADIETEVFEAYADAAVGIGGTLSLAPNGQQALDVVGAGDAVRKIGEPMTGMVMRSGTGKVLGSFGTPDGLPPQLLLWRDELYRALADEAASRGIEVRHGKRLAAISERPDGVTAHFADGTSADGDVLVGADGIRSTVRAHLDPNAPQPRYAGLLGFGARADGTAMPPTGDVMHLVFGRRAFFGYQVAQDGHGGWFVNLPSPAPTPARDLKQTSNADWIARLAALFDDDTVPAAAMIRATDPAGLVVTGPLEDIPSVPRWSAGRVVLVGDSAHPTSPSSGQGASLAAESAVQLARCLRDLPYEQAFIAYEGLRRERAEKVIRQAARTNRDKAAGPVGRLVRDAVFPIAVKLMPKDAFTWPFQHRIAWDQKVTS